MGDAVLDLEFNCLGAGGVRLFPTVSLYSVPAFVLVELGLERTSEVDWSASTRFEENWTGELLGGSD